ncbi:hypothetical protein AUR66_18715 [Haloferax profundi]|uniref:Uncharacterized protein n=1 Tax=Haloferax profundi TaxID=1544718 RepID=A0A0W1RQT9_9EURY|nr:hypothetical protein AUR66_18715 [Haloferax profundi]
MDAQVLDPQRERALSFVPTTRRHETPFSLVFQKRLSRLQTCLQSIHSLTIKMSISLDQILVEISQMKQPMRFVRTVRSDQMSKSSSAMG